MPQPKQTTELIFSLRALIYRLRQLTKERRGYSKAKHRELAKLLRDGQEGLARIKAEDVIANDNLIIALEILELHCERLHVRANILDHLVAQKGSRGKYSPKRRPTTPQRQPPAKQASHARSSSSSSSSQSGGWSLGRLFGFGSPPPSPGPVTQPEKKPDSDSAKASDDQTTTEVEGNEGSESATQEEKKQERDVYIDPELDRDAAAIFYSYARIPRDIPGLLELRARLVHRWGNDFALKAQDGDPSIVEIPKDLTERLRIEKPPESLIDGYLREIARSYKIPFHGETWDSDDEDQGGDEAEGSSENASASNKKNRESDAGQSGGTPRKSQSSKDGIPEIDELAKRFAALKK
ncbi:hypothetical protein KEM54_004938 [Ascosphaera aggregata]|nr:hypothetical protein KEM54_004938 [Ascosphaera aggregata]